MGTKYCPKCEETKDLSAFSTRGAGKPASYCKPCQNGYNRDWRKSQEDLPVRQKQYMDKHKYGLSPEQQAALPTACEVCGASAEQGQIHKDHDHATGVFRGVLCGRHNQGIGHFLDDPVMLRKAADYLDRAKERNG